MNQTTATEKKSKKIESIEEDIGAQLKDRVEHVKELVENVRDQAEVAFRDRPYLVPVTAGAVGFGLGLLLGSKLTRFIVFTAVGTVVSDALGGQIKKMAGDFLGEFNNRLGESSDGAAPGESGGTGGVA